MDNKEFIREDHCKVYSVFRRDIPSEVVETILSYLRQKIPDDKRTFAVDVGCGSGQSTIRFAPFFQKIIGLDVSEAQIKEAQKNRKLDNVEYKHQVAETLDFPDKSVQLITASSCLHWFDLDTFFPEAQRVLSDGGVLATFVYLWLKPVVSDEEKNKQIVELIKELYFKDLQPYWSPKSAIAFDLYRNLEFPFEDVERMYEIKDLFDGTLSDVIGFMQTLSGFQQLKNEQGDEEAATLLANFKNRLSKLLGLTPETESSPLKLCRDFTLVLCRKGSK